MGIARGRRVEEGVLRGVRLASTTAPAARSAVTTSASAVAGARSCRARLLQRVGRPSTSITSLIATGRPCSGPRSRPSVASRSSVRASSRTPSESTTRHACTWGSTSAMRSRQRVTRASDDSRPVRISSTRVSMRPGSSTNLRWRSVDGESFAGVSCVIAGVPCVRTAAGPIVQVAAGSRQGMTREAGPAARRPEFRGAQRAAEKRRHARLRPQHDVQSLASAGSPFRYASTFSSGSTSPNLASMSKRFHSTTPGTRSPTASRTTMGRNPSAMASSVE